MVDVMVSPGDPGPWHRQKEIPLLSGFISAQIPLNLKRPFPFEHSGGKQNTVFDSASPRHSKRHLTTHREPTQPTSRERSEMSHPSLSINHSSIMEDNLCYSLEHVERPRSYADFMNGSVMKRTASSSSHSSLRMTHNSLDQTYAPPMVATVDTYGGFVSYANWAKTPSFASCTEQSPSLSSSFDFTDAATDEPSVPNGLPFTKAGTVTDKALPFQSTNFQFGDSHTSESGLATPWLPWPTSEAELSSQPYFPDNVIEAQNWTNAPPLDNCWSGTEYPISTRSATIPGSNLGFLESASPTPQQDDHTNSPINPIPHYQYHLTPPTQPQSPAPTSSSDSVKANFHYSDSRNALLIEWKRRGLSYKEIKRMGGFQEPESTLRGRFRTLTKAKEHRVRKPKWLERDVQLLCEAVAVCSDPSHGLSVGAPKVSWKKVAQYIWACGGSYQFGNATCKKKWCEIHDLKV